ncbi:hypothetical protein TREMEDRAFT_64068 [Tremella mesenterica DSM 1558]|uniref:uncharacterized protein n=1 Tax=Tremella mesenterica (strain ATCC 24925 / CBS 8224 / DSM 1558 / NBRC 9311 / NRRL Y-6157 / RJB 2259-6 / UBC 559-6) TaxID=578456 RepID=UPI0003F49414|nr:uncharacterized protein TREMEDRAFT_64068 [Tremella mesenterica DSM 1558]EIW67477.1 hypothetical protein TREMEDRAFT_64068 [Tremella mesenterica DSM 1558]
MESNGDIVVVPSLERSVDEKADIDDKQTGPLSSGNGNEQRTSDQIQEMSNGRLMLLATGMAVVWACTFSTSKFQSAAILETAFILPTVGREFSLSDAKAQWIAASYMLTWGCFQVIAGRLCDVYGQKRGLLIGCFTFIIFNVLSAVMPNAIGLIILRGFTGLSSALLLPSSAGLIGILYPKGRKRTFAFTVITTGGAAGAAGGELFGGIFIQYTRWTWRACFMSLAAVTIYPLILGWWLIPADPPITSKLSVDWLGAISLGSGLLLILLGLTISETSSKRWSTPYLPALLIGGVILLGFFIWRQRYLMRCSRREENNKPPPLIPSSLILKDARNVLMIYLASACTWAYTDGDEWLDQRPSWVYRVPTWAPVRRSGDQTVFLSFFVFVSYLYFDVLKLKPFDAGLKLSVTFFSGSMAALVVALSISHVPPRVLMTFGRTLSLISPILFGIRKLDWKFWQCDLWAFLFAAYGTDATIAAGSSIISHTASEDDQSVAAG